MTNKHKWVGTPSITVDAVIFSVRNGELQVLLINRALPPFKNWRALPGGFLWKNETLEQGVKRVLKDKTGLSGIYVEQLKTFDSPARDPRGHIVAVAYFALVPPERTKTVSGSLPQTPTFFPLSKLPKLAFDHQKIIRHALSRLRNKIVYTNIAHSMLPAEFTLTELQNLYEIILGERLDKRNFRKKFLSLKLLKKAKKTRSGMSHRPAQLYSFSDKSLTELTRFF